ncbi:phospholipase D family protein [Sphingosinicella sp. LY1275]|uniref:phospholipase D family protein n=1 Tax=Sphingosinicella sp. LY1275 TaxID=3095379 RepID=UPI002ADEDD9B|nr:phospholipase D family protein [Sphingosinicella sp. LY1275]MEA1015032.1 phospholipase D family protein [Sphingosinicella sp. LY1275]
MGGGGLGAVRDTYGNTGSTGYTINWFTHCTSVACDAYLASPFFTTIEPIEILTKRGCNVNLVVRLCSITRPPVLRQAISNPLVKVRYYTDREFHAKLYIVGDQALIGSANLTDTGLKTNREVSVVLSKDRDTGFGDLMPLYEMFWSGAETLTPEILTQYEQAFRLIGNPKEESDFQKMLETFVPKAVVPSAKVGSANVTKERAFLKRYHQKYDEELIPAFREIEAIFADCGQRRPEFADDDAIIELGRFLGWTRLVHAPGDSWKETTLAPAPERRIRVLAKLQDWITSTDTKAGDMYDAEKETSRIGRLREALASAERIAGLDYDELFAALLGVHAFNDRLRHVSGGVAGLKKQFAENQLSSVKETLTYLLYGKGLSLERAYDCIRNERWKLAGFGEGCIMETLGWMDPMRPPINGRTIKALRFFGFDVHD